MIRALLLAALCALPASAEYTGLAASSLRGAEIRDALMTVKDTLTGGTTANARLVKDISAAFRGTSDWGPASSAYYSRRIDLLSRAAALESRLESTLTAGSDDDDSKVRKKLDALQKETAQLSADFKMYADLPKIAGTLQRPTAQAAMRLLAQTGDYNIATAYFHDKAPRLPFAGLRPASMPRAR